jgi:hypothetical protein
MTIPSHAELLREYLEQLSEAGPESRMPAWRDWMRVRVGGAMALGAALTLAACDDSTDPNHNQGGAAGVTQDQGAGGSSNITSVTPLYAAPMGGVSNLGGATGGVRYAVPLGGSQGDGGQTAAAGGSAPANGGQGVGVLYGMVMVRGGSSSS